MRVAWALFVSGAALVACSGATTTLGSGGGEASTVSGTVGGASFGVVDTVGYNGTHVISGQTIAYAGVSITNVAGTCAVLARKGNPPSAQVLSLAAAQAGSTIGPGTYTVAAQGSPTATAVYAQSDASCVGKVDSQATGGTVTITGLSSGSVQGSFDLTFAGGDHLSGTFSAPTCNYDPFTTYTPGACGS
jgi:hypothetical protein